MPTPRQYATNADRQAAYRARARALRASTPAFPTPRIGPRHWDRVIAQAQGLLGQVAGEMATYEEERSETWQESERGERFMARVEALEEIIELLSDLSSAHNR